MILINTNKINAAIYEAGYTIKGLAKTMGIQYNLFSKKINGRSGFTAAQAFTICILLGLSLETAIQIFLPLGVTESELS